MSLDRFRPAWFPVVGGIAVLAVNLVTNDQYGPEREWSPARTSMA